MKNSRVCNIKYDNELNTRLENRYFTDKSIEPQFGPRPESTKYNDFNTYSELPKVELFKYDTYDPTKTMYTGTRKPQINYYLDNIDVEHKLRNQFFALQKNDKAFYIPDVNSSLYTNDESIVKYNINNSNKINLKTVNDISSSYNNCNKVLETKIFNNPTKNNVKNIKT